MKLNIFTLTWNGEDKIQRLYNSLIPNLHDINYTWYIKDNGSTDGSVKSISSLQGNIKLIDYPNNLQNFSEGNNYLYNISNSNDEDYILLLNNDVVFNDKTSIKQMIKLFQKDKDIGVVGAKLKYLNTDKLQHAGVVFSNRTGSLPYHFRAGEKDDKNSSKNREFQAITGAVFLTKSKYYKNICTQNKSGINGLDEQFIWSFDDIAACLSIKYLQNKKIVYCGSTDIFHEESVSLKKNPVNKLFMNHNINRLITLYKKYYKNDADDYLNSNHNVI